ncbi:MAG: hypothetical protein ACMG6H_04095 [Acidobacteriota bacterium]
MDGSIRREFTLSTGMTPAFSPFQALCNEHQRLVAECRGQLAVMHDPRFAHPYYWAPFVVLGDWK